MSVYNFDLVGSGAVYKKDGGGSMSIDPDTLIVMNVIDSGNKISFKFGILQGEILSTDTVMINGSPAAGSMTDKRDLILSNIFFLMGSGGGGTVAWGSIVGTLSDQADLQAAIDSASGTSIAFVKNETPTGAVNGSNATFSTAFNFVPESVELFINGLKQKPVANFNTVGNSTITISDSPFTGEILLANYIKL